MSAKKESPALTVARAHVEAWSIKDWGAARSLLAPDVHVIAMTTNPALPATDLTGPDEYMKGLAAYADPTWREACASWPARAMSATRCWR